MCIGIVPAAYDADTRTRANPISDSRAHRNGMGFAFDGYRRDHLSSRSYVDSGAFGVRRRMVGALKDNALRSALHQTVAHTAAHRFARSAEQQRIQVPALELG